MLQAVAARVTGTIGVLVSIRALDYYSRPSIFNSLRDTISGAEYNRKYRQNAYVYNPNDKSGTYENLRLYSFSVYYFFKQTQVKIPDNATINISYDYQQETGIVRNIHVTEATIY